MGGYTPFDAHGAPGQPQTGHVILLSFSRQTQMERTPVTTRRGQETTKAIIRRVGRQVKGHPTRG